MAINFKTEYEPGLLWHFFDISLQRYRIYATIQRTNDLVVIAGGTVE